MSKIIVFMGSPRDDGNTAALADAFCREALKKGHEVTVYDLGHMNIKPCRACDLCYSTGMPCVLGDDWNRVAVAIAGSDGVVFAGPVYWYSMTAQLKAVFDRMYCFHTVDYKVGKKKAALISCCEDTAEDTFDGFVFSYKKTAEYLGWEDIGHVLVPGLSGMDAVVRTDGPARAAELADRF